MDIVLLPNVPLCWSYIVRSFVHLFTRRRPMARPLSVRRLREIAARAHRKERC